MMDYFSHDSSNDKKKLKVLNGGPLGLRFFGARAPMLSIHRYLPLFCNFYI